MREINNNREKENEVSAVQSSGENITKNQDINSGNDKTPEFDISGTSLNEYS